MSKKITVVLDLDQTLIYSIHPKNIVHYENPPKYHVLGGNKLNPNGIIVFERPGLHEFLISLSHFSEIILYTAGLQEYALPIVRCIDPDKKYLSQIFFREDIITKYIEQRKFPTSKYIKDLKILNRPLEKVLIFDDEPSSFSNQPDNGIIIKKFCGDCNDNELMSWALPIARELVDVHDVRPFIKSMYHY